MAAKPDNTKKKKETKNTPNGKETSFRSEVTADSRRMHHLAHQPFWHRRFCGREDKRA